MNKELKLDNRARRQFFSYFGVLTFISAIPFISFSVDKSAEKEEFILIDGWLLKKEDLNVI